jgi:hypothetical protein
MSLTLILTAASVTNRRRVVVCCHRRRPLGLLQLLQPPRLFIFVQRAWATERDARL